MARRARNQAPKQPTAFSALPASAKPIAEALLDGHSVFAYYSFTGGVRGGDQSAWIIGVHGGHVEFNRYAWLGVYALEDRGIIERCGGDEVRFFPEALVDDRASSRPAEANVRG